MKDDVMYTSSALKEIVIYTFITFQNILRFTLQNITLLTTAAEFTFEGINDKILGKNNHEFSFEMFNLSHGNGGCRRYFELTAQNVRLE